MTKPIKMLVLTMAVSLLTISCSELLSFLQNPIDTVPVKKAVWTVDNGTGRIIGDSEYFMSYTVPDNPSISCVWDSGLNTLQVNSINESLTFRPSLTGFPIDVDAYGKVRSPLDYLSIIFNGGFDISSSGEYSTSLHQSLESITAEVQSTGSYALPEPAIRGIDGDTFMTELTGELNVLSLTVVSKDESNDVSLDGSIIMVFSRSYPAGLLYMCCYHNSGLVSLLYAHEVVTDETGDYFPDGRYEYYWSIYEKE